MVQDDPILNEVNRKKLDDIVSKMAANNETDEDIQFLVNDFKAKYGEKKNGKSQGLENTGSDSNGGAQIFQGGLNPFQAPTNIFNGQPEQPLAPTVLTEKGLQTYSTEPRKENKGYSYTALVKGLQDLKVKQPTLNPSKAHQDFADPRLSEMWRQTHKTTSADNDVILNAVHALFDYAAEKTPQRVKNAWAKGEIQGEISSLLPLQSAPTEENIREIARYNQLSESIPQSQEAKEFEEGGFKWLFSNKIKGAKFLGEVILESLSAQLKASERTSATAVGMGATAGSVVPGVGTGAGAFAGFTAGQVLAGMNLETSGKILEVLKDAGFDTKDEDQLIMAFRDKHLMDNARDLAIKRGVPIAILDLLSAGLGGRLAARTTRSLGGKIGKSIGVAGIEAGGGSTGEAIAQVASGEDFNLNSVALEGIAELGAGAPALVSETAVSIKDRNQTSSSNSNIVKQIVADKETGIIEVSENLDRQLEDGLISEYQYAEGKAVVEKIIEIDSKIPDTVQEANREKSIELIARRDDLSLEIEQLEESKEDIDPVYYDSVDSNIAKRITKIDELNKEIKDVSTIAENPLLNKEVPLVEEIDSSLLKIEEPSTENKVENEVPAESVMGNPITVSQQEVATPEVELKEAKSDQEPTYEASEAVAETNSVIAKEVQYKDSSSKDLARQYHDEVSRPTHLNTKEEALAEMPFKVKRDSYANFGDRNNITDGKARSYFSKEGKDIDLLAQEINNDRFNGKEVVTPQDVVDFIDRFPNGTESTRIPSGNPKLAEIKKAYFEKNGKSINRGTAKKYAEAAEKVSKGDDKVSDEFTSIIESEGITLENIDNPDIQAAINFLKPDNVSSEQVNKALKDIINRKNNGEQPGATTNTEAESLESGSISDVGSRDIRPAERGERTGSGAESGKPESDNSGLKEPDFFDKVFDQSDVKPILNFLDSLKIKPGNITQASILPVAELYNTAIDIIKSAVKTGNTLAQALRLAKEYLTERGVKEEQVRAFERSITSKLEVGTDKQPTIKQIIRDNTDKRSRTKVVMTELQALKKQMKDSYAGFKEGIKEGVSREKVNQSTIFGITSELRKEISTIISTAEQNKVFSGDVAGKTLANVIKKIAGASDNPLKLLDVIDYVSRVAENAEYDSDLQTANSTRVRIKAKVNSKAIEKSAVSKELTKAFLRLKPSSVEELKEYNEIAKRILNNQTGVTISKDGITNENIEASNQEIIQYIDRQLAFQNKKASEKLLENFKDLVDAGIIDKDSMSLAEMKEIIKSIESADGTAEELLSNEKEVSYTKKRKALQVLLDSKFIQLEDYLTKQRFPLADGTMASMLSPGQKAILESLRKVDTSELDLKQLAKMNDVLNNIIQNDDFSGSGDMAVLSEVQSSTRELSDKVEASGIELGSIKNVFIQGFASTNLMPEFIFKSSKVAAEAQRLSGISDVFSGHARARIEQNNTMKGFMDLKKSLGKGLDTPENRYRRGIYARIIQHFGGLESDRSVEFNRVKELIRQTAEKLSSSTEKDYPEELREGKVVSKVYEELLEGSKSVEDVRAKLEKIAPDDIKLVEYWQKKFAGITDKMAESAEIYDNKAWEDVAEYTPTKMKAVSGGSLSDTKTDKDIFESQFFSKKVDNSPAATKITRTKSSNLPKNAALDLDFDKVSSRKYYESLYDIETNKALSKVRVMLTEPKVAELFGGKKNLKIIQESIRSSVALQKGNVPIPDAFQRKLTEASNVLQAKGARIALGSVSQLLKQYPSVAIDALAVLGTDLPLYFKAVSIGNNLPLFEKFNIGLRGTTRAGYSKEVDLNLIDGIKFESDLSAAAGTVADISKRIAEMSLKTLEVSDVAVARTSWLAFYMQDMKRQGIDINKIDWKKEHENPNNEAAAYAEQQVSRNQNANDGSSMGNFYKQSGNAYANVFKSIFLPFSTFSVNQRVKLTNDVQKLLYGGEKAEAARSLAGTITEQAAFNYIKAYIIASITTAGANAVLDVFDLDDVPIEESKYKFQKFVANTFSDFFYSGMGNLSKTMLEKGSNSLYNIVSDDKKTQLFYQFDPAKYGQPDLSSYGMYAVPFMKAYHAKQMLQYIDGETTKITKGGSESKHKEIEVKMTENETNIARLLFMIEALGVIGVSEADISHINQKATIQFQKHMGAEYGGSFNMKVYNEHLKLKKARDEKGSTKK